MSNVHTGIENTSQGGVSSVWGRTFGGPPWGGGGVDERGIAPSIGDTR